MGRGEGWNGRGWMDRWIEVVDASGQTHLPLKQATRVETVCSCSNSLRGACEFERKKAIP